LIFNAGRLLSRFGGFRGHWEPSEVSQQTDFLSRKTLVTTSSPLPRKASMLGRNTT
jgi:hypothetical protein